MKKKLTTVILIAIMVIAVSAQVWAVGFTQPTRNEFVTDETTKTTNKANNKKAETGGTLTRSDGTATAVPQYSKPLYYRGDRGPQGRHGFSSWVDPSTGNVWKVIPVNPSGVTDERGNYYKLIGQVKGKVLDRIRSANTSYSALKPDGSLVVYDKEGNVIDTIKSEQTKAQAKEWMDKIIKNSQKIETLNNTIRSVDGRVSSIEMDNQTRDNRLSEVYTVARENRDAIKTLSNNDHELDLKIKNLKSKMVVNDWRLGFAGYFWWVLAGLAVLAVFLWKKYHRKKKEDPTNDQPPPAGTSPG